MFNTHAHTHLYYVNLYGYNVFCKFCEMCGFKLGVDHGFDEASETSGDPRQ